MNKIKYILAIALLLAASGAFAQKKIKEYYPDGKLKFEGRYTYTWKQEDFGDVVQMEEPKLGYKARPVSELTQINTLINSLPTKAYDGLCRFYRNDGTLYFEGTYNNAVPDGKFTWWHANGKKSGETVFLNGMADGQWQTWDRAGKLLHSFSYKAIPQDTLAVLYRNFFFNNSQRTTGHRDERDRVLEFTGRRRLLNGLDELSRVLYGEELKTFADAIDKELFKTTIWDGKFLINRAGAPYLEFYYSNNVPSGTWKLWDQDSLQFECSFEAGNMVRPKLHRKVATNSYVKRDEAFKRSAKYDVTPGGDTIFTTVEQSPEFPGGQSGLNRYVAENLKYPKEAKEHDIEGKVLVKITILDDGSVDPTDIKLERSLGYGTDEEIIRLIKNMPKWKPAKLNGWPVKNVYTLPINFKLQ